jgi:hypothetical protein
MTMFTCIKIDHFFSMCSLFWTAEIHSMSHSSGNCILTTPVAAPVFRVIYDPGVDA